MCRESRGRVKQHCGGERERECSESGREGDMNEIREQHRRGLALSD